LATLLVLTYQTLPDTEVSGSPTVPPSVTPPVHSPAPASK